MPVSAVVCPNLPAVQGYYSQAVIAGEFVFISGQLPVDERGRLVGATITEQTRNVLERILAIVTAAGGTVGDLAEVTVYTSDVTQWPDVNRVFEDILGRHAVRPARAVIPTGRLHFGALVEMQAVAHILRRADPA